LSLEFRQEVPMNFDANFITAVGAIAALPVSIAATYISMRADARSKVAAKTQVYLALRSRFIEVHEQLPASYSDQGWRPVTEAEKGAVARYWHHAFDEWYITTRLDHALLSSLWRDFFSGAVLSGLGHNGLRAHFVNDRGRSEHDSMWKQFSEVIERQWRASHLDASVKCDGFACQHSHKIV